MMGGVIARHYEAFLTFIRKWKKVLGAAFVLSASCNTLIFYRWILIHHMPLEDTTNALQQLSTPGLTYTSSSSSLPVPFWTAILKETAFIGKISDRSFYIYLIHPFFLDQLSYWIDRAIVPFDRFPMPVFYVLLVTVLLMLRPVFCNASSRPLKETFWHVYPIRHKKSPQQLPIMDLLGVLF